MAKLTLTDVVASQVSTQNALNGNFKSIENELNDNVLYRNNPAGEPNFLETPLDMNSQRILNLPTPQSQSDAVRLADIPSGTEQVSATLVQMEDVAGKFVGETAEAAFEELFDDKMAKASNLSDVSSAPSARSNLGVEIGVDVQAWDQGLDDISALPITDGNFIVGNGTNWVVESGATARTSLGVAIGTNVQAWDQGLDDISGLAVTDKNIIVGNGTNWTTASILDEDDMVSNSASDVPTQQSTKSYVDTVPLQHPATSTDPALAIGTWRTPNANRPTMVQLSLLATTDGTTNGELRVNVDESGGTTDDYALFGRTFASISAGSGFAVANTVTFFLPAGGSYRVENVADPNANNAINSHQEWTL